MLSASKIFNSIFEKLSDRQREVIVGRFGLEKSGVSRTLAALGKKYGVTRERIRQIEVSALNDLRKEIMADPACTEVLEKGKKYLKDMGGAARKENLLAHMNAVVEGLSDNHLALLLEASRAFFIHPEDKSFWSFYYLDKNGLKNADIFISQWIAFLKGKKEHILAGKYDEHLSGFLKRKNTASSHAENYLSISKKIHRNPFGDKGLTEWPEIKPRTIRERAYLVLKKRGKPLHFRVIATSINEVGFDNRKASAPTVHNELIKDERFVLVGRGMYALAEHGYEPGTAREVIQRVLRKNGALKPRDIILAIQKERFFKPNTVLVNLQNKSFFERLPDGRYQVREA